MGKILVIDDDLTFCRIAQVNLQRGDHEVMTTDSGHHALATVIRENVELVVLDLNMPQMDGSIFLESLRTCGRWSKTPVIIVTGSPEGEQFARVKALGIQAAFDKTKLKFPDLLVCANALLAGQPGRGNVDA
jgi:CheY-like chemotaxis protein